MKVKDLIAELQDMPQDLEVYAYCDHGQTRESPCAPSLRYVPTDSEDDYDSNGYDDIEDFYDGEGEGAEYSSFVLL